MAQHKWHKEIKAWADGEKIETNWPGFNGWKEVSYPEWQDTSLKFRIKPEPVITIEYLQKRSFMGKTCYIAFDPDLEHWDLKITYIDGVADKVELPK